jgi:hypothetical protein
MLDRGKTVHQFFVYFVNKLDIRLSIAKIW